jgi:DNA repair protein RadA/Sms
MVRAHCMRRCVQVMIGGDPGVGKSTLLLQLAGRLAESSAGTGSYIAAAAATAAAAEEEEGDGVEAGSDGDGNDDGGGGGGVTAGVGPVVYVSGEESTGQVAARAQRLGLQVR